MANRKKSDPKQKRKPGRPPGKRSNPNYVQIAGYITKPTYRAVKIKCINEDKEISEVLQILLDQWLKSG